MPPPSSSDALLALPQAVLFDLDGTLVDSERLHAASTVRVLADLGVTLTEADMQAYIGWGTVPFWTELRRRFGLDESIDQLVARRTDALLALFGATELEPMRGARALLDALQAAGIPRAVASSSPRPQMEGALRGAGLLAHIDAWVSGHDDVAHGKPAADPYLEAARRIDADPARCLAVEDSATGAASARAAGCTVVMIPCPTHPERDLSAADHVMESLEELHGRIDWATKR